MAPPVVINSDDWDAFISSDDESMLAEVAQIEKAGPSKAGIGKAPPARVAPWPAAAKNNNASTSNNRNLQQKDLFGKTITLQQPSISSHAGYSGGSGGPVVRVVVRKQWDRTFYAKSGAVRRASKAKAKTKSKGKGKARDYDDEDEDEDEEDDDDLENPLFDPEEAKKPPKPMKLLPDREACKTFVYPTNKQLRKYQYDIIAKAFFTDTLVALPTGLGKTFLAAVLMFNFYRWFPKGKIIFMAPSRPLVTQQIAACHGIVGIPLKDAVELTGKDNPEKRAEAWDKRRVFYCTPQTVKNDLFKGRLDPSDIILMVVDEAHKATGDYAYCEVVRFMMQKNPHFRLLALTATPGSNPEVVQSVIDSLHIGHIEVRSDESMDTRQYIHNKRVDLVIIPVQGEIGSIRERFAGLMDILLKQVRDLVKTQKTDPTTMHPYLFQTAMKLVKMSGKPWAFPVLSTLGAMARCISKLLEQSVDAFFEDLKALRMSCKGKSAEVINHKDFASIYRDTEDLINGRGFAGHPKMVKLAEIVQEHFEEAKKDGSLDTTRIMVFCTFRQVVDEIVERLNAFDGIRATRLVGQGTDTKGKKGLAQKEQNSTLSKFKKGDYNVLVATSIGEEGLDIGELDLIVCYDAAKSPVRTLQRAGRTGRAREGRVIVLMTEGIEEDNWRIANSKYKDVQNAILSGKQFELYADCQRLVPDDIRPVADKKELVIEPFDPEHMGLAKKPVATGRRKRNEEDNLDLFQTGFQKANGTKIDSKAVKPTAKRKKTMFSEPVATFEDTGTLSVAEKQEVESRLSMRPSIANVQPLLLRSNTLPRKVPSPVLPTKRLLGTSTRTASLFRAMQMGQELCADTDKHEAWEIKTYSTFKSSNVQFWADERNGTGRDRSFRPLGPCIPSTGSTAELPRPLASHSPSRSTSPVTPLPLGKMEAGEDESSDDDLPDISVLSSKALKASPKISPKISISRATKKDQSVGIKSHPSSRAILPASNPNAVAAPTRSTPAAKGKSRHATAADQTIITIADSDDDRELFGSERADPLHPGKVPSSLPDPTTKKDTTHAPQIMDLDDPFDDDLDSSLWMAVDLEAPSQKVARALTTGEKVLPSSPQVAPISRSSAIFRHPADRTFNDIEDSPLVMPKKRGKKMAIVTSSPDKPTAQARSRAGPSAVIKADEDEDESVVLLASRPGAKRLRRADDDQEPPSRRRKEKRVQPQIGAFLDTAAINSDNEDTASGTDEDIAPETTSDRIFLDSEDVSNPKDMSVFYRESLMSQTADRFQGEVVRPGAYKMRIHRARILSECEESPEQDDTTTDQVYEASQYVRGSFCVDDSDEVVYSQREDDYLDDE